MPIDTVRLLDSDLNALATGDEFRAAVRLWCKAWHQVPAGSLPDDERILAALSGFGSRWKKLRPMALRGFVKCSDGRLYHPVIAQKALEAWAYRQAQRRRAANRWGRRDAGAHATASAAAGAPAGAAAMQGTGQGHENLNPTVGLAPDGARPSPRAQAKREARAAAERAIAYLNERAGTRFQAGEANLKLPAARILYDGATEQDLRAVVDLKLAEAERGEFDRKYLRPATLWNAEKFAQYVGQVNAGPPAKECDETMRVYGETEVGERHHIDDYPVGNVEDAARRTLAAYGSAPWMRRTRNLIVRANGTESRFSVEELRAH